MSRSGGALIVGGLYVTVVKTFCRSVVGLFIRGSSGHYQYSTDLLPLPIPASPHHPTTQTKLDCVSTSARGLTAPKIAEATDERVSTAQSLSVYHFA